MVVGIIGSNVLIMLRLIIVQFSVNQSQCISVVFVGVCWVLGEFYFDMVVYVVECGVGCIDYLLFLFVIQWYCVQYSGEFVLVVCCVIGMGGQVVSVEIMVQVECGCYFVQNGVVEIGIFSYVQLI